MPSRWILSRLNRLIDSVQHLFDIYQFGEAGRQVRAFLWDEFADWYIELSKVRVRGGDRTPIAILVHTLDSILRVLHPFMPFVTEELWQALRGRIADDMASQLIVAWFPKSGANWKDAKAESAIEHVIEVNRTIRNIRAEKKLDAGARPKVVLRADGYGPALRETAAATNFTSRVDLEVLELAATVPAGEWGFGRVADTEVAVALPEVDAAAERARLEKELSEAGAHAERLEKQLANETFRSKAPAHVIQGMESTLAETKDKIAGLRERLASL